MPSGKVDTAGYMEGHVLNMNVEQPELTFNTNVSVVKRDCEEWQKDNPPDNMYDWSTLFTDGSSTEDGREAGV